MRATFVIFLLMLRAEPAAPPARLPNEVRSALAAVRTSPADKGFPIPEALADTAVARGDFDGNGHHDWAIIIATPKRTVVLVAYRFANEWRSGSIDLWGGPECHYCSQGARPVALSLLAPGSHDRLAPHDRQLLVNEQWRISSQYEGVLVTLADGRRRAYCLEHAWIFVDLGGPS
jgi:hypothetical protein